ncbi:MAG TPA: hypothetical protein VGF91_17370 [Solirubrobacteraceae bacterium]|jgi:hypothetical protein
MFTTSRSTRATGGVSPGSEAEYGSSVALDALGDQLLIGAPYQNNAQGAAWAAAN